MKARRTVYLVLGILLVLLQLFTYLGIAASHDPGVEQNRDNRAYMFGYYVGQSLFLFAAVLCWVGVYRTSRKLKMKKREELLDSIDKHP